MLHIIWIGIQNWVHDDFYENLPRFEEVSVEEFEMLKQHIGHRQTFMETSSGRRNQKKWSDYYSKRIPIDEKKDGKAIAFGRALIESIWKYTLNVWTGHNEALHGKKQVFSKRY